MMKENKQLKHTHTHPLQKMSADQLEGNSLLSTPATLNMEQ